MLLLSRDRVVNVSMLLLSIDLSIVIRHHVCHFTLSELLGLIEARLSVVILAAIISLKLVLDSPHNKLIGCRLVRYLLRANASISLDFLGFTSTSILMRLSAVGRIRHLTTLEIEDIVLNCRERAIITNIKAGCSLLFLFLAVKIYLNLRSLNRGSVNRPLLHILVGTPCIA